MIRNILCFIVGALVALIGLPILLSIQSGAWLAVGVAALAGAGTGLGLGFTWWAIEHYGLVAFTRYAIEFDLLAVVAFTCLALGGAPDWTWIVIEGLAALGVVLWAVRMMGERRVAYVRTPLNLLILLLLGYIFLQLVPIPAGLLNAVQSETVRVRVISPGESPPSFCPVSVNRAATRDHLFLYMAYAAFFFVFINNVTSRQSLGRMLAAVLVCAGVTAVAGFATYRQDERLLYRRWSMVGPDDHSPVLNADANREYSAGYGFRLATQEFKDVEKKVPDTVDFYIAKVHTGDVFGGFPSSNSAATVLVMGLVLALGVFFAYVATWRSEWGQSGGLLFTREGNITLMLAFFVVVTAAGLVLTKSRGALGTAAVCLPTLILLVAFSRSRLAGILTLAVPLALAAAIAIVLTAVPAASEARDYVGGKLSAFGTSMVEDLRLLARQSSRDIIADFPVFGTGLGTFGDVYPPYKIGGPDFYFAHCDVLQWWVETGLVGVALALGILGVFVWTVVVGYVRLKDRFFRRLLIAALLSALAFLLHGLVDFPMAVPGCMILFVAVVASAVVIGRDQIARNEAADFI